MAKYIFLDMNTQYDFLDANGACPVVNRDSLILRLRKVFALARTYHVPVISSLDTHRISESSNGLPKHCLEGSWGQKKLAFTLLQNRASVEANNNLDLPHNLLSNYRQIILLRRTEDFLSNPKADRLITELRPELFVLFGVGVDRSIRHLALSLLARGKNVGFIPEACGYWSEAESDLSGRHILAKGGNELSIERLEALLKENSKRRIPRVFSRPTRRKSKTRRPLAG